MTAVIDTYNRITVPLSAKLIAIPAVGALMYWAVYGPRSTR